MVLGLLDGLVPFVESCAEAMRLIDEEPLRTTLQRVESAATEVAKSWSGSALGYHANVFYKGLQKPPRGARFSIEWGLSERDFPFEGVTLGEWQEYDQEEVLAEILRRAGASDPHDALDAIRGRCGAAFRPLKQEAPSTVDALIAGRPDPTLAELRNTISGLTDADLDEANRRLGAMRTRMMTRDMRALSLGGRIMPAHLAVFAQIDLTRAHANACGEMIECVRRLDSYVKKRELIRSMATETISRDRRSVFIIHGRNTRASTELEKFLFAVGLRPLSFDEARRRTGAHPSVLDVVKFGVANAQAVIALFTPDEWAVLDPALRNSADRQFEKCRWQARPNVPFEAGLAMGLNPGGTVLATLGSVELPSDITGIHHFRLSNDASRRQELRLLLKQLGCPVDDESSHFLNPEKSGDFSAATTPDATDPFALQQDGDR